MKNNQDKEVFEEVGIQQDYCIPDGIGLTIEEIRTLFASKHDTLISRDDPILLVATLLNAYLEKVEIQNKRLHEGMIKLLAAKTDSYVKGVHTATDSLNKSLSNVSIDTIKNISKENVAQFIQFKRSMQAALAAVAISALVNVVVLIFISLK